MFVSGYFDKSKDIDNDIARIENAAQKYHDVPLFIGIDSNSRHHIWNDSVSNLRGDKLCEFLSVSSLSLLNTGSEPTFSSHQGDSVIDLTIVNSRGLQLSSNWRVNDSEEIFSDHKMLSFEIDSDKRRKEERLLNRKYN